MEFKEKLLSSHFTLDENIEIFESVQQIRAEALKVFEKKGFPSKKEESWKYTSLQGLIRSDYAIFPKAEKTIKISKVKKYFLYDTDTYKVVFIDGVYNPFLSDTTHDGLDVCLMSAALTKPKYQKLSHNIFK